MKATYKNIFYLLIVSVQFISVHSYSQDTLAKNKDSVNTHCLRLSTNIVQLLINEISIYCDYPYKKLQTFGINAGYIYQNKTIASANIYFNPRNNPTTAYQGIVARLYYKLYLKERRKAYFGLQFDYKYISYKSQTFDEEFSNGQSHYYTVRTENAYQYGGDLIYGFHLNSYNKKVNWELFISAGYRHRHRNIITESNNIGGTVYNPYNYSNFQPTGLTHQIQDFPMFTVGIKLGINTFFK